MNFIDTHVHFWDRAQLPYPWLDEFPAITGPHTPAHLQREAGAEFPSRIVFVQAAGDATRWLDEVHWIESLAVDEPSIAGIVAYAPMDADGTTTAALTELARHRLVRGVRHNIQGASDPDFCTRDAFVAGVSELPAHNLSFDLCCKHHQLASVIELVRRCPRTSFILDHIGKPDIRAGLLDPWREHIRQLARLPNVVCKLSGLVTEADPATWQPAQLRPYVGHLLTTFGPTRLLFGSDWPVVKLGATYLHWLETVRTLLAPLTANEINAIFYDNARRIYRLH